MGRQRWLCLQPCFLWLSCLALCAHGAAGQQKPPPRVRPAGGAGGIYPAAAVAHRGEGAGSAAAAAGRVRRRGQQEALRGYGRAPRGGMGPRRCPMAPRLAAARGPGACGAGG